MNMNTNNANRAPSRSSGFTLIELLVVIGIIAVLAAILLPALAAAKRRSLRAQDIDNMREMAQGSIMYAGDFNDWYPICTVGNGNSGGKVNFLSGVHYARYLAWGGSLAQGTVFPQVYTNFDQNEGYLYAGKYLGNAHIFYCPALQDPVLQPAEYSTPTFMSADSAPAIRCPYLYNPRLTDPQNPGAANALQRKYQKTTQAHQLDVFITDYMEAGGGSSSSGADTTTGTMGMPFGPSDWAQYPSKGVEVAFTDGSCKFVEFTPALFSVITLELVNEEGNPTYDQYDTIFTFEQNAR